MFCSVSILLIYQEDFSNWRVFWVEQIKRVDYDKKNLQNDIYIYKAVIFLITILYIIFKYLNTIKNSFKKPF